MSKLIGAATLVIFVSILISSFIILLMFHFSIYFAFFFIIIVSYIYKVSRKMAVEIAGEKSSLLIILILPIISVLIVFTGVSFIFGTGSQVSSFGLYLKPTSDSLYVSENLAFHTTGNEMVHEIYRSYKLNGPMMDMRILGVVCPKGFKEKIYNRYGRKEVACRKLNYIPPGDYKMKINYLIPRPYVCYDDYCYIQWRVFDDFKVDVKNISVMLEGDVDFFSFPDLRSKNYVESGGLFEINIVVPRSKVSNGGAYIIRGGKYPETFKWTYILPDLLYQRDFLVLIIILTSIWLLLIFFIFGKEISFPDVPKVLHYPPEKRKPYIVNYLFYGYPYKLEDNGIVATILDLARRGFWRIKNDTLTFLRDDTNDLDPYECRVFSSMKKIAKILRYGNKISFKKLNEDVSSMMDRDKLSDISSTIKGLYDVSAPDVYWRLGRYLAEFIFGAITAAGIIFYFLYYDGDINLTLLSIITYGISGIFSIYFFDCYTFGRYKKKYARERAMWKSFRNLLSRYSLIKKYSPRDLSEWGEWLVYATALGTADKVLKTMKDFNVKVPHIDSPNFTYINPYVIYTTSNARYSSLSRGRGSLGGGWSGGGGFGGGFGGGGGGFR